MGIPFYFKKLFTVFGKKILSKVNIGATCEHLYLDFNCLIHQCAQATVASNPSLAQLEYEPLVIDSVLMGLVNITNVIRPTKTLVIAIDGLCPRAKMVQQRKRRYMSNWRKERVASKSEPNWDSNIITPGSRFMVNLDQAITSFISINKSKFKFDIVFSSSSEPGEGEQKIFDIMTASQDAVIYGLDADLILLSLIAPNKDNIRLLRERPEFSSAVPKAMENADYIYLDVNALSQHIASHFQIPIADYVMLCTLLGNDFLPPLSYLNIRDDGIEKVIDAYKVLNEPLIGPGNELNDIALSQVFKQLAKNEDVAMATACSKYYSKSHHGGCMKPSSIDSFPQYTKHMPVIDPNSSPNTWREHYYASLFTNGHQCDSMPIHACNQYTLAILWVHAYYFERNASKTWYYPHAYSPLAKDLSKTFDSIDIESLKKKARSTDRAIYDALIHNQELQLLSVLPPSSATILSNDSQSFMNDIEKGCIHMYPSGFRVHTFLKTYLWECSPILPPIDYASLIKV